jgi:heat shock protein HslJ
MSHRTACLLTAALAASACGGERPPVADEAAIVDVEWRLLNLPDVVRAGPGELVPEPRPYTLRLRPDGRAAVRSDCNSCSGSYTLAGPTLTFGPLACTRAYCGEASLDPKYPQALETARSWELDGPLLLISTPAGPISFLR